MTELLITGAVVLSGTGARLRGTGGELDSDWLTATAPGARPRQSPHPSPAQSRGCRRRPR